MRFKLDENFGSRSAHLFRKAGHDIATVFEEGLSAADDGRVFETCLRENRCLVSLDLDFSDVVRFPPHKTAGIAVLRMPKGASLRLLERFVSDLLNLSVDRRSGSYSCPRGHGPNGRGLMAPAKPVILSTERTAR